MIEFNLSSIAGRRVRKAILELVPDGLAKPPGTFIVPIEVRSYQGNGIVGLHDFHRGTFVTAFDQRATTINVPVSIDVTRAVRQTLSVQKTFLGFAIRTNIEAQFNVGSLEVGLPPTLVITFN